MQNTKPYRIYQLSKTNHNQEGANQDVGNPPEVGDYDGSDPDGRIRLIKKTLSCLLYIHKDSQTMGEIFNYTIYDFI